MAQETFQFKFEGDSSPEVIIRHGDAEPIHVPGKLVLAGNFNAPAEFVNKRSSSGFLDAQHSADCHVIFNSDALSIVLVVGEQESDTITVVGKLRKNPFLESLYINARGHKHKDLLDLIRFKAHYFANREDHKKLVLGLQNFEVKTESSTADKNDRQGTTDVHRLTRAQSSLTGTNFQLYVPLFEGYDPAPIDLTIEVEPNNGTVLLFLVSETFEEFYETAVKAQFDAQRPVFEPFVIIEQ